MSFTKALFTFLLVAAPVFTTAVAVVESVGSISTIEARDTFVFCRPHKNSSPTNPFKISVDHARKEAQQAGFHGGKSGDPHGYGNGDRIHWGVDNCDNGKNDLFEYPIYWEAPKRQNWLKDVKSKDQSKTPIRVVYANKNGGISYCGVMTHSEVDRDYQGKEFFQKCA